MIRICRFRLVQRVLLSLGAFLLLELLPGKAVAAGPQISSLSLRGLQTGATTTLRIEGDGLLPDPRLLLPVPIASQAIKSAATPHRVEIEVTLPEGVSPGMYQLRLA